MAHVATPEFLARLKALYPSDGDCTTSPWYAVAAITFAASNCPEAVPLVLKFVLDGLGESHADRLAAVRKIRDAVFKSGMICGFPMVINALLLLHEATPDSLRDTETLRNPDPSIEELTLAGKGYFYQTYGEGAQRTEDLLGAIYPDLGFYVTNFGYGYTYAYMGATSAMETSFAMISALIAIGVPKQIEWHLGGAIRNGATREEVKAVRTIAMEIAQASGVVWKQDIPDLE